MKIEFKDVCTNLKHYEGFEYKNYGLSESEAEAILNMEEEAERLRQIRNIVSQTDFKERNEEIVDYYGFYEAVKEFVG